MGAFWTSSAYIQCTKNHLRTWFEVAVVRWLRELMENTAHSVKGGIWTDHTSEGLVGILVVLMH